MTSVNPTFAHFDFKRNGGISRSQFMILLSVQGGRLVERVRNYILSEEVLYCAKARGCLVQLILRLPQRWIMCLLLQGELDSRIRRG